MGLKILAIILFLAMYVLMTLFMRIRVWIVLSTAVLFLQNFYFMYPASIFLLMYCLMKEWKIRNSISGRCDFTVRLLLCCRCRLQSLLCIL